MLTQLKTWIGKCTLALLCVAGAVSAARADTVSITYSPAGQTTPDFSTICAKASICDYGIENFSAWNGTSSSFVSSFNDAGAGTYKIPNGVSFTGTYSVGTGTTAGAGGEWIKTPQDQYGGVNGVGYPALYGPTAPQVTKPGNCSCTLTCSTSPATSPA
jgi:hypothetical protein